MGREGRRFRQRLISNHHRWKHHPPLCHPEQPTCLRQVKREMNDFSSIGCWLSFRPLLSRLPTKRFPLDGCPMFAFSRTWVEQDLFPMLSPPEYTYLQEKKKERASPGFPVEFGGVGELHAAFLTESRTRGHVRCSVQEIRVAHLFQPMYAKTRTWGTRPGGNAGEEARDLWHNQRMTLASRSWLFIRSAAEGSAVRPGSSTKV